MKSKMSLKEVCSRLCGSGMTIRKTEHDEYRVNFRGGKEATAYYTTDLDDAYNTGVIMAKEGKKGTAQRQLNEFDPYAGVDVTVH
jgi:hypothetical protein